MSEMNDQEQGDPAGSTMSFRRFVADNKEPEAAPKRPVTPYVLAAVGALLAIGIIITVVVTWS
ncbi:hypothetical protein [Streptomonospora litoralis]|uniref:Uncharacterized protein n=1 Tax=Streptomonospora litoralis TaxID=2498135 RepID=A0A4P6PY19_9ACTN|nr:hypothetical protein [Streptomonospora litoralis]QBI53003.1 hypothetical protein EKD16_06015 [Streptomonospora litoralis]